MDSNSIIFKNIIKNISQNLENRGIDPSEYVSFLSKSELVSLKDNVALILTDTFISKTYLSTFESIEILEDAFSAYSDNNKISVRVETMDFYKQREIEDTLAETLNDYVSEEFTFDNFIVGPSNREAKTAALCCAMKPGQKETNPLFIYGNSGLGKTHLLHSIGNYIKQHEPDLRILYISAEKFVREVYSSIENKTIEEYKSQLFLLDVLLVDDIQFLSNKTKANEVFFTAYNELINNHKQIVLTSDRSPVEIKDIEERLKTRFTQGLSVTISSLEFETAYKILEMKFKNNHDIDSISPDVLSFIANNYSKDVRMLEGALKRLLFYSINFSTNSNHYIDIQLAMDAFKDDNNIKIDKNKIEIKDIMNVVCDYYGLTKSQLISKDRKSNVTNARHIAMYLCRKHLDVSYLKIGEEFAGRDHSTVLSACEKIEKSIKEKEAFRIVIKEIENKLFK